VFYSSSFELRVHLHGIIVLDIFFINPNSRPLPTFLPFPHGTRRRIQACRPHTTSAIPRRQAEALHRRALAGQEAHLGANHPDTLGSMHNLAGLLWKQGKLEEAGLRVFGVRGDLTARFTKGIFLFAQGLRPGFSFVNFPILLDYFFGRNTSLGPPSTFHSCNRQNEHMAKLSNLSGEFLQMMPIDGYSINISI